MAKTQKHPLTNRANKYARDVVSGRINASGQVKQACQRHLDDLKKSKKAGFPYKWDPGACEDVLMFAQEMPHIKGKWAGTKIILEPWQCFCIGVPYGWIRKSDGMRRFREIYEEIPRKNGKSTVGAIIGNYMFTADGEPGSEVYSAATTEKQAHEVFRPAWLMVNKEAELRETFFVEQMGTPKNPGNMYSMGTGSRFECVVGTPGDGSSPHCWLQDEYHESKTSDAYNTGQTGMGARSQPMMVVITTAGTNTSYPCYALRKKVEKILSGDMVNDEIFGIIYTIDDADDWTDFKVWKKANPNFGVSVSEDFLKSQYRTALQDPRMQNIIKCKHLNIWSNAGSAWLNGVDWARCANPELLLDRFEGMPVYIGLDLASKVDLAAKIYIFREGDKYFIISRFYVPEERTYGEDMAHYAGWAHEGYLITTPGSRIDIEAIQKSIEEDAKRFDLSGSENGGGEVCNDPWNAQQLITNLMQEDIACVEVPQTVNYLSEPMKEIEALVKSGNLEHDNNPVMNWNVHNVVCRVDMKGNVFPRKEGEENKIDGAVAKITGMARAMYNEDKSSVYDSRPLRVV